MSAMHPKATDTSLRISCRDGPIGDVASAQKPLGHLTFAPSPTSS